jgi:hypothetical protein
VPKPSYEHDHLDKEYKGRNGVPGRVSEPDGFGNHVQRISKSEKALFEKFDLLEHRCVAKAVRFVFEEESMQTL